MTETADSQRTEASRFGLERWSDLRDPVLLIALAWSVAQIAFVVYPSIDTLAQRALHVGFALALAFGTFGQGAPAGSSRRIGWMVAALVAIIPAIYIAAAANFLTTERIEGVDGVEPIQYLMGVVLVASLFVAAQRLLGWGLAAFAAIFVLYFFLGPLLPGVMSHRYGGLERFIDVEFLSMHGIFGVPTGVSVSTVFYFILFAAIYDVYGGGRMIIDLAFAMTGRTTGGPAKAAVVASGLLGSVSGSAVANVMSTGIFTIPLMKRVGYSPRFAGAVEAAASTGGQLVPPVMGAAAFVMADYLQMRYQTIVLAAILPAVAYYFALLLMVDLKARAERLVPSDALPDATIGAVLAERAHLLAPLGWLVYRVVSGYPVQMAALEAIGATIVVGSLRANTRRPLIHIVEALIVTAERAISVALPCAIAGIVVAVIAFTGLGTKFTGLLVWIAGGSLPILLGLTMLASLVLGTGMPTTSAYIMAAVLLAPAMIEIGIDPLAAHFFVFYFAILSMVTPPVALAAYAAASISGAAPSRTGVSAFLLCVPGFLIPFVAIVHPGLLLMGGFDDTAWALFNLLIGFTAIAVALIGWLFHPLAAGWRAYFAVAALLALMPDIGSTLACIVMLAIGITWHRLRPGAQALAESAAPANGKEE